MQNKQKEQSKSMSQISDNNKSLTVKFFEQVFNQQNYDIVPSMLSTDYKYNGRPTSAAETVAWAKGLRQKYPDLHFIIEAILGEDEKVALRWRMTVTDAASGTGGYVTGTNILVFVDGKALANDQGGGDQFIPNSPPTAN
jgi:predicted ester cyclase